MECNPIKDSSNHECDLVILPVNEKFRRKQKPVIGKHECTVDLKTTSTMLLVRFTLHIKSPC